jgi:hypothetical protein
VLHLRSVASVSTNDLRVRNDQQRTHDTRHTTRHTTHARHTHARVRTFWGSVRMGMRDRSMELMAR